MPGKETAMFGPMMIEPILQTEPGSGGYTPPDSNFDAVIFVYHDGGNLRYFARTRYGFTPSSRQELFKRLKPLEIQECPFATCPRPLPADGERG